MNPMSIVMLGGLLVFCGGALLHYSYTLSHRRSEILLNGLGVALLACGLAVVRDGATGSRHILWMLPDQAIHAASLADLPR